MRKNKMDKNALSSYENNIFRLIKFKSTYNLPYNSWSVNVKGQNEDEVITDIIGEIFYKKQEATYNQSIKLPCTWFEMLKESLYKRKFFKRFESKFPVKTYNKVITIHVERLVFFPELGIEDVETKFIRDNII